ncbi:right-handed parallel beta-helix repeat-containing protein, partial [bacterium]|nr:right-handed parallel beta-helix repeat-containing protein [bacterium]
MKKSILLALIILIFPLYLYASDYYVDAVNGSNENSGLSKDDAWKTITYALTQVEGIAEEQTVIHVAVGTYDMVLGETFPLNMKDYITLKGAEKETTIIDASGSNTSVIFIKDVENVCIESIRITNGSGIKEIGSIGNCIRGGGLYIKDSENIAISNCIINNNILLQEGFFFLQGGGIYSFESSVEIEECVINDNQGGGVCFEQIFGAPQKEFVIRECTVNNNTGDSTTAGIDCIFTSPLIEDSTIIGNIGNGIFLTSSNATIKNCTIKGNNYGGLDLTFSSPVIANCDVSENTGKGGIYCWWDCYPEIRDCRINGNSNDVYNQGGGLYFKDSISTPIIIKNCEIAGNSANMGGGLYFEYSNGEISKCKIKNNIASDAGGGICCRGVSLSIRDCEITGNKAVYGGGIHDYYSSGQITDSLFAFNEAVAYGGAVHVIDFVSEEFDFIIQNCTIADNQAGIAEGGVSVAQGSLFIENSILWNNKGG